jgi:succinate dehydrogenase/fumarate reductase-like Fe-S protein
MDEDIRTVRVFRRGPESGEDGRASTWEVRTRPGMSIMDLLDDIVRNIDPTLAYYTHSRCDRGVCARCAVRVNGKTRLACQTPIPPEGDIVIEPAGRGRTVRDLVAPGKKTEQ